MPRPAKVTVQPRAAADAGFCVGIIWEIKRTLTEAAPLARERFARIRDYFAAGKSAGFSIASGTSPGLTTASAASVPS